MFNLLVGFPDGVAYGGRVVEHTEPHVREYIAPDKRIDPGRLASLPTMVMPELGDTTSRQVAQVGHIEDLVRGGDDYRFRFVPNPSVGDISTDRIERAAGRLLVDDWEFSRTHWAVKDVDLYRVLQEDVIGTRLTPRVFRFPVELPQDPSQVAVMMPFGDGFNAVYGALRGAVEDAGMQCLRADDIWESHAIMDDVIRLIWTARVVIADLSTKNPNVFYETGIAHSLGRDVIQVAQTMDDVPFDLRPLRTLTYLNNNEGLTKLRESVTNRLHNLVTQA